MALSGSSTSKLTRPGRVYVRLVTIVGGVIIAHSLWAVLSSPLDPHWILFAALTLLGGALTIKVPQLLALLSVAEMFAFTCVLLFGPAPGTLTLAIDGVILSLRRKHRPDRLLFNAAELGISMWVSSHLFFSLAGVAPLYEHALEMTQLILPMGVMTAVYFLLNSGFVATAIGLESGTSPVAVWRRHFAWLIPTYFAGASISLLLVLALRQAGVGAVGLILPLLLLSYFTVRSSLGRIEDANEHVARVDRLYLSTVETLATAIDAKDEVTHGHIRRVQMAAVGLARALGVNDEKTIKAIEAAALLHDTGKLAIPEHILNKPGKLTAAEFEVMKQHARIGAEILASVDFPYPVVPIVRHHHENWNGTGYPDGVSGTDIPIGARVLSVVDCFDALTSDRPYRRRMTDEASLAILRERSGIMYDPLVVERFIEVYQQIMPRQESVPAAAAGSVGPAPALPLAQTAPNVSAEYEEDLLALTSLGRALSPQGSLSDMLALIWTHIRRMVPPATMAAFYSVDETGDAVLQHTCGAVPAGLQGLTIEAGHGVSGWVAATRRPMVNSQAALDLGELALTSVPALESCLSVPLLVGETLIGVITLYAERPAAFDEAQGRLMQTVAPHISEAFHLGLGRSTAAGVPGLPATGHSEPRRQAFHVVSRR